MSAVRDGARGGEAERREIIAALIAVIAEQGYDETTVEMVQERAGLSTDAFERQFRDKEECFLAACQWLSDVFLTRVIRAHESEGEWRDRMRAMAYEAVRCIRENPSESRVLAIEAPVAGVRARELRDAMMRAVATLVDAGREEAVDPHSVQPSTAEGIVGAFYSRVCALLRRAELGELERIVPEMMCFAVAPYLGMDAGLEELRRAPG